MRLISFSMTVAAFLENRKTVTRRLGWRTLRAGDVLMGVEKAQGLKRGEKVRRLGALEVVSVRREPLAAILDEEGGTTAEGFPDLTAPGFVELFCAANGCGEDTPVTRIEFRRCSEPA